MTEAASLEPMYQFPAGTDPAAYPFGVGQVKAIHRLGDLYDKYIQAGMWNTPDGEDAAGNGITFNSTPSDDAKNRLVIELETSPELTANEGVILPKGIGVSLCRKNYPEAASTQAAPLIYNTATMVVANSYFGGWSNNGLVWGGQDFEQSSRMGIGLTNHSAAERMPMCKCT